MPTMLVDASGYIYRAFYVLEALERSDGFPTGAILGFCRMLWKLKKQHAQATHFAVIFDAGKSAARTALYPAYKDNRKERPVELVKQLPHVRGAARAFGFPVIEKDGVEADDLLASYAEAFAVNGDPVIIVSPDKDMIQLIRDDIGVFCPLKDRRIGMADSLEKFGVPPRLAVDAQAVIGDTTDNIPGIKGIGPKKIGPLLSRYGSLDALFDNLHELPMNATRRALEMGRQDALLSRQLATLDRNVPLPAPLRALEARDVDAASLLDFARHMEFHSFAADVASFYRLGEAA